MTVLVVVRPVDDVMVVSLGCVGGVEAVMSDDKLVSRLLVVVMIAGLPRAININLNPGPVMKISVLN